MSHDPAAFSSEFAKAHGPNWLKWLWHLVGKPCVHGLELGCWKGESAEWSLENIFTGKDSTYVTVDTFEGSDEHRIAGIDCSVNEKEARERLKRFPGANVWKGKTDATLFHLHGQIRGFDFIYVDAAHDAMNVLRDSVLAFELLYVGGVMIWDDYAWTVMQDEIDRPRMAVDAFLACYARRLEIVSFGGWQVCVRKVA